MIFQPHRYSRTRDLYEDFVHVLSQVDVLILLDVYSAGEDPVAGASSENLSDSIRQKSKIDPIHVKTIQEIPFIIADLVKGNDLVLTQGAGSVSKLVAMLVNSQLRRVN
jgi:UDP-N-acetylmuramate--alanine ligase